MKLKKPTNHATSACNCWASSSFKKPNLILLFVILTHLGYSQGKLMNKLVSKLAKSNMVDVNSVSTATLVDMEPVVGIGSNLHPVELGTLAQSFLGGWKTGGDMVSISFFKKNSSEFYKIDGTVTIDGKPAEYLAAGTYSLIFDANASPRKVEIATQSGEKSSFTISPSKSSFKILSINGQKDNISIDPTKDVTIELDGISASESPTMKVSLAVNQLGMKSFIDVCFIRMGSNLVIPAAAFRNMGFVPAGKAVYNYKNSYLSVGVERIENATEISGIIPTVQYTGYYSDGKFVTVTAEPDLNKGLTFTEKKTKFEMDYDFFKPAAFFSRPFGQIKKIGLISFSIRGTTFYETSSSATFTVASNVPGYVEVIKRTTISTYQFPQQPNEVWDALMEKLYPELMAVVKSEFGCDDIPVDQITSSDAYKFTKAFTKDDANTKIEFARSFRNTQVLSAFMPVSEGYGANSVNERIMKETGADALMTMTLDLQIAPGPDKKILMVPKFAFEIVGKNNGSVVTTKYCTGNIASTSGVAVPADMTPSELEAFVRKADLLTVFRQGLQEIIAKEKANGDYETVWGLQK